MCGATDRPNANSLLRTLAVLGVLLGMADGIAWGQQGQSEAPSQLKYFRLLVPRKEVAKVATRHLPMERDVLQAKLKAWSERQAEAGVPVVRLEKADYRFHFDGRDLVGEARWTFAAEGAMPAWVPLQPMRLALRQCTWETGGAPGAPEMALAGVNDRGEFGVVVDRAGVVVASASVAGEVLGEEMIRYHLELPACPATSVEVALPSGWQVRNAPSELVSQMDAARALGFNEPGTEGGDPTPRGVGERPWRTSKWRTAGGPLEIVLERTDDVSGGAIASFEQKSLYALTLGGIEWQTEWSLRVDRPSLRTTILRVPDSVSVLEVKSGATNLSWVWRQENETNGRQLLIHWPDHSAGLRRLQVSGIAPLPLGKHTTLPILQLVASGWQQHLLTVQLDPRLQLSHLATQGCVRAAEVDGGRATETFERLPFVAESEEGTVEFAVALREVKLEADAATHLLIRRTGLQGTFRVRVEATEGEVDTLPLEVAAPWRVDSIDCDPPERLEAAEVVVNDGKRWRATLRLREPITRGSPLEITLHAHHPPAEKLAAATFRPLLLESASTRRWVAVDWEEGLALQLIGDSEVQRVSRSDFTAAQEALLPAPRYGLIFRDDHGADRFEMHVAPGTPRYEATTLVEATARPGILEEHFRIQCRPTDASMSRLRLRVSSSTGAAIAWRVVSPSDVTLTARHLEAEPSGDKSSDMPRTEEWELLFGRDVSEVVVLEGTLERPLEGPCLATLVYLPHAVSQQAQWALHAEEGVRVGIQPTAVRSIPLPPAEGSHRSLVAWFGYSGAGEAKIALRPLPDPQPVVCWAARSQTLSSFDLNGAARHQTRFFLVNQGRPTVQLRLPKNAKVGTLGIRIHGKAADWRWGEEADKIIVALPQEARGAVLDVDLRTGGPRARWWARLQPVVPEIDVPVLAHRWCVSLPGAWCLTIPTSQRRPRSEGTSARIGGPRWPSSDLQPASLETLQAALDRLVSQERLEEPTWGEWLEAAARIMGAGTDRSVWVAEPSLRMRGLVAATPLWKAGEGPRRASELLREYSLTWLVFPEGHVLGPAEWSDWTETGTASMATWVPLEAWTAEPPVAALPWERTDLGGPTGDSGEGRVVTGASVWGVHRGVWAAGHVALWALLASGIVWTSRGRWLVWWFWTVGAALWAALWPVLWGPWGLLPLAAALAGGAWMAVLSSRSPLEEADAPTGSTVAAKAVAMAGWVVLAGMVLWRGSIVVGADGVPSAWAIVVPVDDQGKPVGEYDYVPRALYELLVRDSQRPLKAPRGWMVERAVHHASGFQRGGVAQLGNWLSEYWFHVIDAQREVTIPVPPLPVKRVVAESGGVPVDLRWQVIGDQVHFRFPSAGEVTVRVECGAEAAGEVSGTWDVRVLPAARSLLRLAWSMDSSWSVDGAIGRLQPSADGTGLEADLGSTDRVVLRGSVPKRDDLASAEPIPVRDRWWLHIHPDSVVVEYLLESEEGLPEQFHLDVDASLQPLVLRSGGYSVTLEKRDATTARVGLSLRGGAERPNKVALRFLWRGRQGVGRFRLPHIVPRGMEVTERTAAVDADASLSLTFLEASGTDVDPAVFAQAWGSADVAPPRRVLRGTPASLSFEAATRLEPPSPHVTPIWSVHVSDGRLEWTLELDWQVAHGRVWRHLLQMSPGAVVQRVIWRDRSDSKPLPFVHEKDGSLSIWMPGAVPARYTMRIDGFTLWRRAKHGRRVPLPHARFPHASVASTVYRLWRDDEVLVVPGGMEPLKGTLEPAWEEKPNGSWWIGSYRTTEGARGSLAVRPNRPRVRGWLVTHPFRENEGWYLEIVYGVTLINAGAAQLDSLRLDVPATWKRMEQLSDGVHAEFQAAPDAARQRLVLTPREPISHARIARFVVPLAFDESERMTLPEVVPLDDANIQRYVVLPRRIGEARLSWITQGVFRRSLPSWVAQQWKPPAEATVFRVVRGSRPTVVLDRVRQRQGKAEVWLADLLALRDRRGTAWLVGRYDLISSDRPGVELHLPRGATLVAAQLDDRPARISLSEPGRWWVELAATSLPQRLEVICRWNGDGLPREAPRLERFRVRRTLWTALDFQTDSHITVNAPLKQLAISQADRLRFQNTVQLLDQAVTQGWQGSPETIHAWYRLWLERLACIEARQVHLAIARRKQPQPGQIERALQAAHFETARQVWDEMQHRRPAAGWLAGWLEASRTSSAAVSVVSRGWKSHAPWVVTPHATRRAPWWVAMAVLLVGLAGARWVGRQAVERVLNRPSVWAWLAGLVLYAFTGAAVSSLALLAVAIFLTWHYRERPRHPRRPSSEESRSRASAAPAS